MTYSPPIYDPVTPASGGAPRHDVAFYALAERRHGLSRTIRDDVATARIEVINGVSVGIMADTLRSAYYARQGAARTRPELVVHGGFTGGGQDPATGRRRPLRAVWRFAPGAAETLAAEVLLTAGAEAPYVLADYRALRRIVRSVLEPTTRGARVDALVRSSGGSLDVAEAQRADADMRRRRDDDEPTPAEHRAVGILGTLAYGPTGAGSALLKLAQAGEAGASWARRIYGELAGGAFRDPRRSGAMIAAGVRAHAAGVDPLTATIRPIGIYAIEFA